MVSRTGTTPNPFGFVGREQYQTDADSGLQLLGHRYYDPYTGRFISQDPIADGDNWYAYVENNPITGIDPEGLLAARGPAGGNTPLGRLFRIIVHLWTIGVNEHDNAKVPEYGKGSRAPKTIERVVRAPEPYSDNPPGAGPDPDEDKKMKPKPGRPRWKPTPPPYDKPGRFEPPPRRIGPSENTSPSWIDKAGAIMRAIGRRFGGPVFLVPTDPSIYIDPEGKGKVIRG